jgi:hypothetical protein
VASVVAVVRRHGEQHQQARTAVSHLRASAPERVRVVPFEADTASVAILEVYPALWSAISIADVDPSIAAVIESARSETSADVRDGALCALAAACYERNRTGVAEVPAVVLPPDNERVRSEGWMYAPRPILQSS